MIGKGNVVTFFSFLTFFKGVSPAIEDDSYFEALMRNSFAGFLSADSTIARRILVIHTDGTQEIVTVDDDGFDKLDSDNILQKLTYQYGISSIAEVRL